MRIVGASLAVTVLTLGAAFAFEQDQSRPGGVYTKVSASTPQACARACEDDNLCMAWTLTTQSAPACELKAVIPNPQPAPGMVSGVSSRAPRLLRLIPQTAPLTPPPAATAVAVEQTSAPAPVPTPAAVVEAPPQTLEAEDVVAPNVSEPAPAEIAALDTTGETVGGSGLATLADDVAPASDETPDAAPTPWDVVDLTSQPEDAAPAAPAISETPPTPATRPRPSSLRMGR